MLLAGAFFIGTLLAHDLLDGFASLDPFGDNAIGNLYHLVGYLVGCVTGFFVTISELKTSLKDGIEKAVADRDDLSIEGALNRKRRGRSM